MVRGRKDVPFGPYSCVHLGATPTGAGNAWRSMRRFDCALRRLRGLFSARDLRRILGLCLCAGLGWGVFVAALAVRAIGKASVGV